MSHVVAINPFEVPSGDEDETVAAWDRFATCFSSQPGYVCAQRQESLDGDARFRLVTVALWESAEDFANALQNPALGVLMEELALPTSHPGLYRVIRG